MSQVHNVSSSSSIFGSIFHRTGLAFFSSSSTNGSSDDNGDKTLEALASHSNPLVATIDEVSSDGVVVEDSYSFASFRQQQQQQEEEDSTTPEITTTTEVVEQQEGQEDDGDVGVREWLTNNLDEWLGSAPVGSWDNSTWRMVRNLVLTSISGGDVSQNEAVAQANMGDNDDDGNSNRQIAEQQQQPQSAGPLVLPITHRLKLLKRLAEERPQSTEAIQIMNHILKKLVEQCESINVSARTAATASGGAGSVRRLPLSEVELKLLNHTYKSLIVDYITDNKTNSSDSVGGRRGGGLRGNVPDTLWNPNALTYRLLMELNCHHSRPAGAMYWLSRQWKACEMKQNPLLQTNRHMYTTILRSWAILSEQQKNYTVNSERQRNASADQAARLMQDWLSRYRKDEKRDLKLKPTEAGYVSLITTFTNAGRAEDAELVLVDMVKNAEKDMFYPSTVAYNAVLNGWAKFGNMHRAEHVFRHMCHCYLSGKNEFCLPDTDTFTKLIKAWGRSREPDAPLRAEKLLKNMHELYEQTKLEAVQPNVYTYSAVLECWAKSVREDAPQRTRDILDFMIQNENIKPNVVTFNTCMHAWARTERGDAPDKVEEIYQQLLDYGASFSDAEKAALNLHPDSFTFMARINAWDRAAGSHRRPEGAERAHAVLREMIDAGFVPSALHCNRVIHAWAVSGNTDQAESVLNEVMMVKSRNKNYWNIPVPNITTLNFLMLAWLRNQTDMEAHKKALACFDRIVVSTRIQPDAVSYNSLLNCWCKTLEKRKKEAGHIDNNNHDIVYGAWSIWTRMSNEKYKRPDISTYQALFRILRSRLVPITLYDKTSKVGVEIFDGATSADQNIESSPLNDEPAAVQESEGGIHRPSLSSGEPAVVTDEETESATDFSSSSHEATTSGDDETASVDDHFSASSISASAAQAGGGETITGSHKITSALFRVDQEFKDLAVELLQDMQYHGIKPNLFIKRVAREYDITINWKAYAEKGPDNRNTGGRKVPRTRY